MREHMIARRWDALIIVGLLLLPLAFFWQVTLGGRTLIPADNLYQYQPWATYRQQVGVPELPHNTLLSDLVLENYAWKQFIRDSISAKEWPLWNPYLFAGVPFLAAGQHSALYPFSLIYYIMPLESAYGWFTVSQLWLAGVWMYLFMRSLGVGRFGGTVAATIYQMSSFFLASVVFPMIIAGAAWLPFLLLMVELIIQQRPLFGKASVLPWLILGAIGLGMTVLAGHVEFVYYNLLVMGFWSAWRLIGLLRAKSTTPFRQRVQTLLKPAFSLLALVALGLSLGAVQFIPLLELGGRNFREGRTPFEVVLSYAYPPRHALAFLMPNLYGSPAQHVYYDVFSGGYQPVHWQVRGQTVTDTQWPGGKNYVEGACYVGILTLALAAVALLNAWRERAPHAQIRTRGPYRAMLATLAVISLTFVFGLPTYAVLYYGLPGINQLHSPFRWVFPLTLCLAALAGFGAHALRVARGDEQFGARYWQDGAQQSFTFRLARSLGYGLVAAGIAVLGGLLLSRLFFEPLRGVITLLYDRWDGVNYVFPNIETFYSMVFREVLLFGLFLIGAGAVIRVSRCPIYLPRWLGRRPVFMLMGLILLAIDLSAASIGFNPAADPAWLRFEPPVITWLKTQQPSTWRFTTVRGSTETLNANTGWLYGLRDVRGYDSMIPKQYVEYMKQIAPQPALMYNRIAPIYPDTLPALESPLLAALGVKYVITETGADLSALPSYKLVYQDAAAKVYENLNVQPRARLMSKDGALMNGAAAIISEQRNQVTLNVSAPQAATLVLYDSYFPGWKAFRRPQGAGEDAEQETPISLAQGNFRSIEVPQGKWTVRFRYAPASFQTGAFVSFMAGIIVLFMAIISAWQTFYTERTDEHGHVHRFARNSLAPIFLNLFNRAIDFAFAAIMLRILGPSEAGTYYYAVVIFGWFDTITNFGLNLLLTREVARNHGLAKQYLLNSSVLRLALALAAVPLLLAFLYARQAASGALHIENLDSKAIGAILLLYVGLIPNSISYGLTALFYAFEKAELPAMTSTISAILKAAFGLIVLLLGWGVLGLASVSILLNLITLAILGWQVRALLREYAPTAERPRVDPSLLRYMMTVGWPLMLNNLLSGLFYKIDVTLLEPLKGREVVGQYSTAYKWLDALGIFPSLFTMALLPIMSRQAHEDRSGLMRNYLFAVKLLVSLALPIAVITSLVAYTLIGILGGARYLPDGAIALQLMVWFIPIGWINSLTNYVLIALDQQRPMRWAFLAGVLFNIIANLIFIPLYSYRAAAVVTILSEGVLLVCFYWLLRRALGQVDWVSTLWKFAAAALLMGITFAGLDMLHLPAVLIILATCLVYPLAILILKPFSAAELDKLGTLLPAHLRWIIQLAAPLRTSA